MGRLLKPNELGDVSDITFLMDVATLSDSLQRIENKLSDLESELELCEDEAEIIHVLKIELASISKITNQCKEPLARLALDDAWQQYALNQTKLLQHYYKSTSG